MAKEQRTKGEKNDLQTITQETKDRITRTPLKTGGDRMCSGREVRVMVFNGTFNNISAISRRSILLMEETEVPEKTTYLL